MALTITIDSVDVTDKVRLEDLRLEMKARQGEVGTGALSTDDTTGVADYAPLATQWVVTESDATPTTIAGGFVAEREIDRGPLTAGTQRQFAPVLEDWNTHLSDRVFGGAQANRPEETDYARITWLLGTNKLGLLGGAGQVPNTNTVTMDPTDYRGKTPLDVLDDCAESANKNFYVYYDSSNTDWRLYYDKIGSTEAAFSSSLFISDLDTDIDSSTTFGASDIEYVEDPERIYSGLLVKWASGWVFEADSTTESTYRRLQRTVIKENIKTAARAAAWAQRQLEKLNEPTKKLSLTVSVPGSKLGELRPGWRIRVKLRARGITAYTYFRIEGATISPREKRGGVTDVEYDVRLKMVDKIRPVNLDDTYGGGDSSGGQDTGGSIGGIGDGGGTTGDGSESTPYVMDDFNRSSGQDTEITRSGTPVTSDQQSLAANTIVIPLPDGIVTGDVVVVVHAMTYTGGGVGDIWNWSAIGYTNSGGTMSGTPNGRLNVNFRLIDGTEGYTGTNDTIALSTATASASTPATSSTVDQFWSYAFILKNVSELGAPDNDLGWNGDFTTGTSSTLDPKTGWTNWANDDDPAYWLAMTLADDAFTGSFTNYTELYSDSKTGLPSSTEAHFLLSEWTTDSSSQTSAGITYEATGDQVLQLFAFRGSRLSGSAISIINTASGSTDTPNGADTDVSVTLPNGSNVVGRHLLMYLSDEWNATPTDFLSSISGDGWTRVGTSGVNIYQKRIDGTEGWTGTGDTYDFTVTGDNTISSLAIVALMANAYDEYPSNPGLFYTFDSSATADPDSVFTTTYPGRHATVFAICHTDGTAITGGPSGYTEVSNGDTATNAEARMDYKTLDEAPSTSGTAEDPGSYTTSGVDQTYTVMVRGGGDAISLSSWGSILEGGGVDTDAPWEGGNDWTTTVVTGTADVYVDGTSGRADITADGSQVSNALESDTPDDPSTEPWGPWAGGDAELLMRWKVNPVGNTADTSANLLEVQVVNDGWKATFRHNLGDAGTYTYQSGGDERGIVILQSTNIASDYVEKTIASDTWYFTRMDFRGTTVRMKMWAASVAEPISWDIDTAKIYDTTTQDVGQLFWRAYGNDAMDFYVDYIDATLSPAPGGSFIETLPPGDGTTTTWTIRPWVGGIIVWVDGIRTEPASFDPAAGTFTFDRAPADGAVIRVEYTAA